MDLTHPSSKPTLRKEPSDISNFSVDSTPTLISSPQSPFYNRAAYQPIAPLPEEEDISYKGTEHLRQDGDTGRTFAERSQTFGLGIDLDAKRRTSVPRVPVGSKASPGTPPAIDPLLSPPIDVGDERHLGGMGYSYDDEHVLRGTNPSNPSMYQAFVPNSEHEALHKKSLSSTVKRADRSGWSHFHCLLSRHVGDQTMPRTFCLPGRLCGLLKFDLPLSRNRLRESIRGIGEANGCASLQAETLNAHPYARLGIREGAGCPSSF